jgi:signal transduction histidine kinase
MDEPSATHPTSIPDPVARARRSLLGVSVVALVVLLQVATQVAAGHDRPRIVTSVVFLAIEMPLLMGILSMGYAWAMRRRMGSLRTLVTGIMTAGIIGAASGVMLWLLSRHFTGLHFRAGSPLHLSRATLFGFANGQLHFGLWALAFVFPFAAEDARVRSLEADKFRLEAEKLRAAAELARLRAHLEPHFLLNTLNAIAGFVTEDPKEARRLLVCLGDLLRDALRDEDEMQTLEDQIGWLRRYAEILEARHAGHLVFRWEIAGETRDMLLPRLLLQPLVENAVKHGALKRHGGGEVVVRTAVVNDGDLATAKVVCMVEDNGPGIPAAETRDGAFGLHAVRRRLELKYTHQAHLRLESSTEGTRSIVELPRQPASIIAAE